MLKAPSSMGLFQRHKLALSVSVSLLSILLTVSGITFWIKYSDLKNQANGTFLDNIQTEFPALHISQKIATKTEAIFSLQIEDKNLNGNGAISFGTYFLDCPTCLFRKQVPFRLQNVTIANPLQKLYFVLPNLHGGIQAKTDEITAEFKAPEAALRTTVGSFTFKDTQGSINVSKHGKSKDIAIDLTSPIAGLNLSCPNNKASVALKLEDLSILAAGSFLPVSPETKEAEAQLLIQQLRFKIPANALPLPPDPEDKGKPLFVTLGGRVNTPNKPGEMSVTLSNWKSAIMRLDKAQKGKFINLTGKKEQLGHIDLSQFPSTMTLAVHLDGTRITGKFGDEGQSLASIFCFDLSAFLAKFKKTQ